MDESHDTPGPFHGDSDWLSTLADMSPEQAVAVARLVVPSLIEVRGCALLAWRYDEANFDEWWNRLEGDVPRIEAVMNHIHLWDVFLDEVNEDAARDLVALLERTWRLALAAAFPDRDFVVIVGDDPEDYGPTISFHTSGPG